MNSQMREEHVYIPITGKPPKCLGRRTFVVSQGEVEVAGGGRGEGEVEAVAARRFVLVHRADGLDHLRTTGKRQDTGDQSSLHIV